MVPPAQRATQFALIGAAGYVAPRHMRAIREIGGDLRVAFDPNDSVGIIDSHFPDARFFVEFERFDRHVDKLRRGGEPIDYVSICSPNYLHDAHVRFALRSDAEAICEKPLVLNPWNLDGLADAEARTHRRVNTIMQLRLHPAVVELRQKVAADPHRTHEVELTYITSRGGWYDVSWKGSDEKSGGVATNIGVHFFDMLIHVFGPARRNVLHLRSARRSAGYLELAKARVRWYLSIAREDLPARRRPEQTTWRAILIDGEQFEFSEGFGDLHTQSYREIVAGRGFGIEDVRPSIEIVSRLRQAPIERGLGELHPLTHEIET